MLTSFLLENVPEIRRIEKKSRERRDLRIVSMAEGRIKMLERHNFVLSYVNPSSSYFPINLLVFCKFSGSVKKFGERLARSIPKIKGRQGIGQSLVMSHGFAGCWHVAYRALPRVCVRVAHCMCGCVSSAGIVGCARRALSWILVGLYGSRPRTLWAARSRPVVCGVAGLHVLEQATGRG
ncbi:F-box/SPRY domain-containing protein 1 [Striga asiatica]|uniref:F-box/SPRY domain-containing protein 1 n=1 Tax=Striga asiatica TaxID=4170 RepID=A0A5A7PIA5_STRAF|nr:F-box/SPRY domain-containing protein 1 [Striga asiatica]